MAILSATGDRRSLGSSFSPGARVDAPRPRSVDGLSLEEGVGPTMSVGTTDERETEAERPRDSDCLSSNFSTFPSPTTAQIVQAISASFHDTFASAAEAEKTAEAATEALAARSNIPVNQHPPVSLTIPEHLGRLQQLTITDAYNPTPSVVGRSSWTSYGTNETLPRYAEHGSPGPVSPYGGGLEIGHSNDPVHP
jgi:hypothetical protein